MTQNWEQRQQAKTSEKRHECRTTSNKGEEYFLMASASRNLMKALVLFRMLINNICLAVRIVYIHHIGAGLVVTRINLMLHTDMSPHGSHYLSIPSCSICRFLCLWIINRLGVCSARMTLLSAGIKDNVVPNLIIAGNDMHLQMSLAFDAIRVPRVPDWPAKN